jgi:Major tropism determinant N-terminal domain/Head fiber protein
MSGIYKVSALRKAGLAADWTTENVVLQIGEIGIETDSGKSKIGDGATAWASLAYVGAAGGGSGVTTVAGRSGAVVLTIADVTGAAPSASPVFTGVPAAPTATAGTSTTQLATTAFVATAIAAIPGSTPYTLPTATSSVLGGVHQAAFMAGLSAAPTQADFNGLLGKLIAAGLMASS